MQVGIISDVHGDYETLVKTLERLDTVHQVNDILCAGDLVGRGPEQNRVVDVIRERAIVTVRGNHDEWFSKIDAPNKGFLKDLPLDWRGEIGGVSFYMCHGKPGNNMWGMYRDHLSDTYLNMVLGSLGTQVLVTGHTHVPLFMRSDAGCILNPGSLYTFNSQRDTSRTYGVLHLPELQFELFDSRTHKPVRIK